MRYFELCRIGDVAADHGSDRSVGGCHACRDRTAVGDVVSPRYHHTTSTRTRCGVARKATRRGVGKFPDTSRFHAEAHQRGPSPHLMVWPDRRQRLNSVPEKMLCKSAGRLVGYSSRGLSRAAPPSTGDTDSLLELPSRCRNCPGRQRDDLEVTRPLACAVARSRLARSCSGAFSRMHPASASSTKFPTYLAIYIKASARP